MSAIPKRPPVPLPSPHLDLPGEDELPYEFGPPMETSLHRSGMNELIDSLAGWLADQGITDTYVGGNMALYYCTAQLKKNDFIGPDVFVARPTSTRPRKSWVVWEETVTPCVVIELLSESTEKTDRTDKMRIYAQSLKVAEYFLFDPVDGRLEGYRLSPRAPAYVVIPPDPKSEEPLLDCEQLHLRLGVRWDDSPHGEVPHLRWMTPTGEWIPTPIERSALDRQRAALGRQRAEAADREKTEAQRQTAEAQARAERLAAQLRALGIDPTP